MTYTIKTKKVHAGLYEYRDYKGRLWIIDHVTIADGFAYNEWHCGTEDDPHANQHETKYDALQAIGGFIEEELELLPNQQRTQLHHKILGFITISITENVIKILTHRKKDIIKYKSNARAKLKYYSKLEQFISQGYEKIR